MNLAADRMLQSLGGWWSSVRVWVAGGRASELGWLAVERQSLGGWRSSVRVWVAGGRASELGWLAVERQSLGGWWSSVSEPPGHEVLNATTSGGSLTLDHQPPCLTDY